MSLTSASLRNPWLVRRAQPDCSERLFCFAYAGGSAAVYAPWQAALGSGVEVCAIQLPGRGTRLAEPPLQSFGQVVAEAVVAVQSLDDRPFSFFGHSLGALLAFEVARQCMERNLREPRMLFVSGCEAPTRRSPSRGLHLLPDDALIAELRSYNGTPREVLENRELMTLVLPILRADFALVEQYRYRRGNRLSMPIVALAGEADPYAPPERVAPWLDESLTAGTLRSFPGDHFFIHGCHDRLVEHVAGMLAQPVPRRGAEPDCATI